MSNFEGAEDTLADAVAREPGSRAERSALAVASVRATLAVAEQMRIANLIAVRQIIASPSLELSKMSPKQLETMLDIEGQVNGALGL